MGVNPSKSADFIHCPLTSSPIFASKLKGSEKEFLRLIRNVLKINHIDKIYVIEVAKL